MGRVLVRWNDDHDKELLLWVVYCCNEAGLKIPFDKVAYYMGSNFTEGAIVQHLAKVRTKMDESGLHPPPATKRGVTTRAPSSIYRRSRKSTQAAEPRRGTGDVEEEDDIEEEVAIAARPRPPQPAHPRNPAAMTRSRRVKKEPDIKQESNAEDNLERDPDGDYGVQSPKRKRLTSGNIMMPSRSKRSKTGQNPSTPYAADNWNQQTATVQHMNQAAESGQASNESFSLEHYGGSETQGTRPQSRAGFAGPAMRTRSVDTGYAQAGLDNSEDEEPELNSKEGSDQDLHAMIQKYESMPEAGPATNMYQTTNQNWYPQQGMLHGSSHGFDNSFNGYNFSQASGYSSMPPPSDTAFNPVPYPANVNPYAPGHSEPVSRVQSMSSATSYQSPDSGLARNPYLKNERSMSRNAFGTYSTGNDMDYTTNPAFDRDEMLAQIVPNDQHLYNDAVAGIDSSVSQMHGGDPSHGLPPVHGSDLDFDPSSFINFDDN